MQGMKQGCRVQGTGWLLDVGTHSLMLFCNEISFLARFLFGFVAVFN